MFRSNVKKRNVCLDNRKQHWPSIRSTQGSISSSQSQNLRMMIGYVTCDLWPLTVPVSCLNKVWKWTELDDFKLFTSKWINFISIKRSHQNKTWKLNHELFLFSFSSSLLGPSADLCIRHVGVTPSEKMAAVFYFYDQLLKAHVNFTNAFYIKTKTHSLSAQPLQRGWKVSPPTTRRTQKSRLLGGVVDNDGVLGAFYPTLAILKWHSYAKRKLELEAGGFSRERHLQMWPVLDVS